MAMTNCAPSCTRRTLLGAGIIAPAALWANAWAADGQIKMAAPMRCADFLASLGVNTHLRYADSQYNAIDKVLSALNYCGFRHLRDIAIAANAPNAGHYGQLAEAGMRFCMVWGTARTIEDAITQIGALEAAHHGCVEFLEGPNEIQPHFAYGGKQGLAAGQQFMADMKGTASANPYLSHVPLVSLTSFAPVASVADYANHHPYPKAGVQPGDLIRMRRDQWVGPSGAMPGKPMVLTEFGYHTLVGKPAKPGHWQGVDEDTQAILILNGLLDAASDGISRTYIYQLFDGNKDEPGHNTQEKHFGLFRFDGQPKPAASAIRNLGQLLADATAQSRSFALKPFAGHLTADRPINALPLQSAGGEWLALWQEAPIWDQQNAARAQIPTANVSLALPNAAQMSIFEPTQSANPNQSEHGTHLRIMVGAAPVLVRIA